MQCCSDSGLVKIMYERSRVKALRAVVTCHKHIQKKKYQFLQRHEKVEKYPS